jgi:membrane-associated phospholipid phosphatase
VLTVLDRSVWLHITALGDNAVSLPCIVLIALWLAPSVATRGLAWRWQQFARGVITLVASSNLAFIGRKVSVPGLDFTGLSGHSAAAAVVWPALGALWGGRRGPRWQTLGALMGWMLALAVGVSRLALHAHSMSEVVLGLLLGSVGTWCFLWRYRVRWRLPEQTYVALFSLLLVLPLVYGHRFPSQSLLSHAASALSEHPVYTRHDLHQSRAAIQASRKPTSPPSPAK